MPRAGHTPLSVAPAAGDAEPDLAPEHKAAILSALRWAWQQVLTVNPQLVARGREEEITAALQERLNEQRNGERCAHSLAEFETVTRGEKQTTSDGRLEKQPDLTFRPPRYRMARNLGRWAWFVECKIIDEGHSVSDYCAQGVGRFSSGEYAAWMSSAAMVAYVRDGSTPFVALDKHLRSGFGTREHARGTTDDMSRSRHDRQALSRPCVDLALEHVWLKARGR